MVTVAVQIMGKTRTTFDVPRDADQEFVLAAAKELPAVQKHLEGKTIRKAIYVPGRIVNFVVGG